MDTADLHAPCSYTFLRELDQHSFDQWQGGSLVATLQQGDADLLMQQPHCRTETWAGRASRQTPCVWAADRANESVLFSGLYVGV